MAFCVFFTVSCRENSIDFSGFSAKITGASISRSGAEKTLSEIQWKAAIDFLSQRKGGWTAPMGTYPTPRYTIFFYSGNETLCSLWIGTGWIGTERGGTQYMRQLTDDETGLLMKIVNQE